MTIKRSGWNVFFLLIALSLLCSCNHSTITKDVRTDSVDSQRGFARFENRFAEHNGILYFENASSLIGYKADTLMFYDTETGITGPLCGKPECTHHSRDCNAYIGPRSESDSVMPVSLFFYDDRVYNLMAGVDEAEGDGVYLYSIAPDGTGRKKELKLGDYRGDWFPNQNTKTVMHRGYVFACGGAPYISDGEWIQKEMLIMWSLKSKEKTILYEWEDTQSSRITYSCIQAFENSLYYLIMTPGNLDPNENRGYTLQIIRWDLDTMAEEKMFTGNIRSEIRELWVTETEIYLSDSEGSVYRFAFSEMALEQLFSFTDEEDEQTDQVCFSDGFLYGFVIKGYEDLYFTVRNQNGELLTKKKIQEKLSRGKYIRIINGSDGEKVYVYYSSVDDVSHKLGYLHKLTAYRIEDGEEKVLWKRDYND